MYYETIISEVLRSMLQHNIVIFTSDHVHTAIISSVFDGKYISWYVFPQSFEVLVE